MILRVVCDFSRFLSIVAKNKSQILWLVNPPALTYPPPLRTKGLIAGLLKGSRNGSRIPSWDQVNVTHDRTYKPAEHTDDCVLVA